MNTEKEDWKLYLLHQCKNNEYGTYDLCVVVAKNEKQARHIHPSWYLVSKSSGIMQYMMGDWWLDQNLYRDWACPGNVEVEEIGLYIGKNKEPHVITASYNAG